MNVLPAVPMICPAAIHERTLRTLTRDEIMLVVAHQYVSARKTLNDSGLIFHLNHLFIQSSVVRTNDFLLAGYQMMSPARGTLLVVSSGDTRYGFIFIDLRRFFILISPVLCN